MTNRLSVEDWIAAGFRALAEVGPQALKAEPLARRLNTTKGSFYWHFKDVPTFQAHMLALWEQRAVTDIVNGLSVIETPQDRLRALVAVASDPAPEQFGGAAIEPAIRAWSLADKTVAKAVAAVNAGRIKYLAEQLRLSNRDARHAVLIYGAYVGLDDLAARGTEGTARALADLIEMILA